MTKNKDKNKNNKATKIALTALSASVGVAVLASAPIEADAKSSSVTFGESMQQSQSKTVTIPNLKSVSNVKANTGTVTHSVSGNNVTFNVTGGNPTRSVWNATKHSKTATYTLSGSASAFSSSNSSTVDNFDSGSSRAFSTSGGFAVDTGVSIKNGTGAFSSGTTADNQTKTAQITIVVPDNARSATLSFNYAVSSEMNFDFGRIHINGQEVVAVTGQMSNLVPYAVELTPGTHTMTISYSKDGSASAGLDKFIVDDLRLDLQTLNAPTTHSYSDAEGFSGTLSRLGGVVRSGGTHTPKATITAQDSRTTSAGGNPNSLPATLSYNSGGYVGTVAKFGAPYVIAGSEAHSTTASGNIPDGTAYAMPKSLRGSTYNYNDGTYSGILYWQSEQYVRHTHLLTLEVTYSAFSNSASHSTLSTLNHSEILAVLNRTFGPNNPTDYFQNIAIVSSAWSGGIQTGSFYQDGMYYPYKRDASVIIKVDAFQTVPFYSGTVSKADDRVWRQDYMGYAQNAGSDTRTWKQEYSGTATKGDYDHYYAYNVTFDYIDNSDPTIAQTSPTANSRYSAQSGYNTMTLGGTVSDADSGDVLKVYYRINGTAGQAGTLAQTITANGANQAFSANVNVGSLSEGTHTMYMWVEDDKGGKSQEVSRTFVVDKTAPTNASFSPSTTSATNGNVSLTINYPSDAVTKQYKIGANGTWTNYTGPLSITANNTIFARSADNVGNMSSESSYAINNIDKTAPTITLTPSTTAPTNQNVTITANVSDNVSVSVKKWASGSQTASHFASNGTTFTGNTFEVSANGTYTVYAKDTAGNETVQTITVSNIDKVAPTAPTLSASTTAPTNGNVNVTITYPSDAVTRQYRINGGTWTAYTAPVAMTANGTVEARGIDQAGNISALGTLSVTNIDKTAPTIALTPSTTAPTNQNVTVTVTASDNVGIAVRKWASGNQTASHFASNGTTFTGNTFEVSANGTYTVYVRDTAGNETVQTITVNNIDKVAPTTPTLSASTTAQTNGNVNVTITYPSDAVTKQYRINGGAWTAYTTAVTMTANGTVEARGIDQAGNISAIGSLSVSNIDKTAPTIALTPSTTNPTNQNVTITANISDNVGVAVRKWASGNQTASYFASNGTELSGNTFAVSANGTYTVYVKDTAGNETVQTITVSNIDKTPPANATFSPSTTALTNGNVSLTINFPTDAVTKQYKLGASGTWTNYTGALSITANNTVYARSYDQAGNVSAETNYAVTNIDKTAPTMTLTPSTTNPTNQNVTVTATIADANGIEVQKWATGNQTASYFASNGTAFTGNTFAVSANGTYTVYAKDKAGNETVQTITVNNIDKVAPTTPTLSASTTAPTNGNVSVTITYPTDAVTKQYRINGGAWTAYTTAVSMTANGTVEARAIDEAGNISAVGSLNVANIDKTAPTLSLTPSTTSPTNQNVTVTVTANDNVGIAVRKWASGTQTASHFATGGTELTGNTFVVSANGTYTVYVKDTAGNETVQTITVNNIDKVAPTTPTLSASTTAPTNGNVNVTITYPSDAVTKQYRINGGTWTAYTTAVAMTANGTVEARAIDEAGNISAVGSLSVTNIDKTAPTIGLTPSTTNPTNQNVTVTVTANDNVGIAVRKWASGTQTASFFATGGTELSGNTFVVSANGTYTVYAKDTAGNETVQTITINNIDKTAPANATFSPSTTALTNGNVSLTINFPSDAVTKQYKLGASGTWTNYTGALSITANNTVYARSYDQAGNVSAETNYAVTNIDKTAPTITLSPSTTNPTNQNVTVTATIADANGIEVQKWASGNQTASYFATSGTAFTGNTFAVTANGTYTVYAKDKAGNETVQTITVNNIDKVAPTTPTLSASTTAPTNGNVNVTISFPSDAVTKQYRINGGAWTAYTAPVAMTANGTVEARGIDEAGNISAVGSLNVANIDKTAPTLSLTPSTTSPTNQNVTVTVTANDNVGIAVRKWASGSQTASHFATGGTTLSGNTFEVSTNGTYTVYVKDTAGNETVQTITVNNIDKVAPTTPTLSASTTAPTNGNVNVTINYPSDAVTKEYRINGGNWTAYTTPVAMTANGTVEARAIDNAGNISAVGTLSVTNIDKVAPTIGLTPSTTSPTNQNITVTANISDNVGVAVKKWATGSQNASHFATGGTELSGNTFVVSANGTYTVYVKDTAGNETVQTITINNIDKTPPANATFSASNTALTNGNVSVTITYPSDAVTKQYKLGENGTWTNYTGALTITANNTIYARSYDQAGNVSAETNYAVTNIDKTAPTITLTPSTTNPTNQDVTVTATIADTNGIEVQKWASGSQNASHFASNGTAFTGSTFVVSTNGTYTVYAKDKAGNETVQTITISNIDKVAPNTPTLAPSTTNPTNGTVSVTITYPSDAVTKQYRINGGAWTAYTTAVTMSANGTVEARAIDEAGNISAVGSLNIANIDKTAPTIGLTPSTTNPTNQNVTITTDISDANGIAVKKWATGNQTATYFATSGTELTGNTFVVSENGTYTVYAKDRAGNETVRTITVNNIDKVPPTAPTLSASTTAPTNGNVNVTISYPSDAVTKEYRINGGAWTAYTTPVAMTANGTVEARAIDQAGNISTLGSLVINNIDKVAPTIALTPSTTAPTNQNVTITANISDNVGVAVKKYASGNQNASYFATNGTELTGNTFSASENGTYTVYVKDTAGNETVRTITVSNIDKVPPTTPTLTASTTAPTNANVNVTISYPSDAVTKQYRINGGDWTAYTTAVSLSANGTVEARAIDNAGNVSAVGTLAVTNIDKSAPVIGLAPSTTAPTNGDVTITTTFTDNVGVAVKKYAKGNQTATYFATNGTALTGNDFSVSENGVYTVYAKDTAGNETVKTITISNIDKEAPTAPTMSLSTTAPTNGNVAVTANFPSDAVTKQYRINGGAWTAYTAPVTMTANGKVEARGIDEAGNISAVSEIVVSNIDKVAPTIKLTPATTAPTNKHIAISTAIEDNVAISVVKYAKGNQTASYFASNGTAVTNNQFMATENGVYTVYAKDTAGNETVQTITVSNIDVTPPTTPTLKASNTAPTNQNVSITIDYPSDAKTREYRVNGGNWTAYTTPVTMSANGTVEARAIDEAGNVSAVGLIEVKNINKVAPKVTLSPSTNRVTNEDVTISVGIDAKADVAVVKYAKGTQTASHFASNGTTVSDKAFKVAENGIYTVYVRDVSGNETVETIEVKNIDKVPPTTPVMKPSTTAPTNQTVSVSIEFPTDAVLKQYRVNGGEWHEYADKIVMSANGTVEARAFDEAGNVSSIAKYVVNNLDFEAPEVATFAPSTTAQTNKDVSLVIKFADDADVKQYKVGDKGEWTNYTDTLTIDENTTIFAKARDEAGNWSDVSSYVVNNIDKVLPTIDLNLTTTRPTNKDVEIRAFVADNVEIVSKKWAKGAQPISFFKDGGTAFEGNAITATDNGVYTVYAKDSAGNEVVKTITVENIDRIAPENPTVTPSTTAPTNTNVTLTVRYPGDVVKREYKVGNGEWKEFNGLLEVEENGVAYFRGYDEAGNVSEAYPFTISNIDRIAPDAPTVAFDTAWTNKAVKVAISYPQDAVVKQYKVGESGKWLSYEGAFDVSENVRIYARAYDEAGNVSEVTQKVVSNIDKVAPTQSVIHAVGNKNTVNIESGRDEASGVKAVLVQIDGGEWNEFKGLFELKDGEYTIRTKTIDNAGNESSVASETVVFYKQALEEAEKALQDAIDSKDPADIEKAKDKISKLPEGAEEKAELEEQLRELEKEREALDALENALGTFNPTDIDKLFDIAVTLPDGELKTQISVIVEGMKKYNDLIAELDQLIKQLEFDLSPETRDKVLEKMDEIIKHFDTLKDAIKGLDGILPQAKIDELLKQIDNMKVEFVKEYNAKLDILNELIEKQLLFNQAKQAVADAENLKTWDAYNHAKDLVAKLPDGAVKVNLENRLYLLEQLLKKDSGQESALDKAIQAVEKAEQSKSLEDLETAKKLVIGLPTSQEKTELLTRLDKLEKELVGEREFTPEELAQLEQTAKDAVDLAEELQTDGAIQDAYDVVFTLPSSPLKEELLNRLEKLAENKEKSEEILKNALELVEQAEHTKDRNHYELAKDAVNKLPASEFKTELLDRLANLEYLFEVLDEADGDVEKLNTAIKRALRQAETFKRDPYITRAKLLIDVFPDSHPDKADYVERINKLIAQLEKSKYDYLLARAEQRLATAERLQSRLSVQNALEAITALPHGADKLRLLERLNAISNMPLLEQVEAEQLLALAERWVEKAEESKAEFAINEAQAKIDALLDKEPKKAELQTRLDAVKAFVIVEKASEYLVKAEQYLSIYYLEKAEEMIAKVSDKAIADKLNAKKAEILALIEKDKARKVISEVERAEITPTEGNVQKAKEAISTLTDEALKAELTERIAKVEAHLQYKSAVTAVEVWERRKTNVNYKNAVDAVNLLAPSAEKNELLVRLGLPAEDLGEEEEGENESPEGSETPESPETPEIPESPENPTE